MHDAIQRIRVIGDVTRDVLVFKDRQRSETLGGAFFVTRMLETAFRKSGFVMGYERPKTGCELNLLQSTWPIAMFPSRAETPECGEQPLVFRCVESPRSNVKVQKAPGNEKDPSSPTLESPTEDFQVLVIEDLNIEPTNEAYCWDTISTRRRPEFKNELEWKLVLGKLTAGNKVTGTTSKDFSPRIIAMINRKLPDFKKGLWKELHDNYNRQTLAIVYADILRWEGFNISKQISWERTAQDFLSELYTDRRLKALGDFQHLVVRFGITGAIHSYKHSNQRTHRLYFDPTAGQHGIYRDSAKEGDLIGNNSIYVTSLLESLVVHVNKENHEASDNSVAENLGIGIQKAMRRCQRHFRQGYGSEEDRIEPFMKQGGFNGSLFHDCKVWEREVDKIANVTIPVGNLQWTILNQSAEYNLLNVAQETVLKGVQRALNSARQGNQTIWVPIVRFGNERAKDLVVVDRREIESYRSVHNLIREALHSRKERPLSVAVFGPAGSGKSFSISRLAGSAGIKDENIIKCNLAELTSVEELRSKVFNRMDELESANRIPLAFLDEFDCEFKGKELGWLKYFLPIMEDRTSCLPVNIDNGNPILVFAGGINQTYEDFTRNDAYIGQQQRVKFIEAKGPDFVSRLRGHIDVIGPNPVDEYDQGYVLRRAVRLRSILVNRIGCDPTADVGYLFSPEIARAMLRVSTYKHGARSMRSIVDMCVKFCGVQGKYVSASLPTLPQLNMHVDGKEFMDRLIESRRELELL